MIQAEYAWPDTFLSSVREAIRGRPKLRRKIGFFCLEFRQILASEDVDYPCQISHSVIPKFGTFKLWLGKD